MGSASTTRMGFCRRGRAPLSGRVGQDHGRGCASRLAEIAITPPRFARPKDAWEAIMTGVFGDHVPGIPYRPIADLLGHYRDRDPAKTAIVDLDSGSAITFGELDRITTEIACLLKSRGVAKGSRVLLLSDESLEKLLLWFGIWRLGAVVCPLNIEIKIG